MQIEVDQKKKKKKKNRTRRMILKYIVRWPFLRLKNALYFNLYQLLDNSY